MLSLQECNPLVRSALYPPMLQRLGMHEPDVTARQPATRPGAWLLLSDRFTAALHRVRNNAGNGQQQQHLLDGIDDVYVELRPKQNPDRFAFIAGAVYYHHDDAAGQANRFRDALAVIPRNAVVSGDLNAQPPGFPCVGNPSEQTKSRGKVLGRHAQLPRAVQQLVHALGRSHGRP